MQMWWSSIFTSLVAPHSPLALIFLNEAIMATCFDNFFFFFLCILGFLMLADPFRKYLPG